MNRLLNRSLKKLLVYAAIVLCCSIPVYYFIFSTLLQYELNEHNIILTEKAGREDSYLIIAMVTILTVLFSSLLLVGLVLLNRRLSRKLWRPFYDSLAKIKGFDLNRHQTVDFEPTDIAEFAELNANLDKLITSSISAYSQQKKFTENASHELQTPLAIMQSKLDLFLQEKNLSPHQYQLIRELSAAVARTSRVNKNLLMLAKIDNKQFEQQEMIDLSMLLKDIIDLLREHINDKSIILETNITDGISITGNKVLVEVLLQNLLFNAYRHNWNGGELLIHLDATGIIIANSGKEELDTTQLFKRFASTSGGGTGLGLAIVQEICTSLGWSVRYAFENRKHYFYVHFT
ncbi:sensor histidine kinase [Olivibacter domesticus]|uniref:histidine kinase n=1 Tax=Olivibacter domesticus TaxID=407022 RepID=A0A1H7MY45_OLID1|nr:HAMP domain-containing sensor histidine kinase [Olivibacter domesticus]SEL15688.1 Signal transduction histidine kinase [Olivibacter domesticus]